MCLKCENVCFGYKKNNLILNKVNISLERGEVLGLIGEK
jgi:peptide/nickel transport system ATP-binding protein